MPVANCFIKERNVSQEEMQKLTTKWSDDIGVNLQDVCLTFVPNCMQAGQRYEIMVNLYLPSLWTKEDIKRIPKSLHQNLCDHFEVSASEVFIITSIVQSGHVVENGQIVEW